MEEARLENHNSPNTRLYWYRKIAHEDVVEEMDAIAQRAAIFFARDLNVPIPKIQWFVPERWELAENGSGDEKQDYLAPRNSRFHDPYNIWGNAPFEFQDEILIRETDNEANLISTIAHEMRHVRQEYDHGSQWREDNLTGQAEAEALIYEAEARLRYPEYVTLIAPKDEFSIELARALELPPESEAE